MQYFMNVTSSSKVKPLEIDIENSPSVVYLRSDITGEPGKWNIGKEIHASKNEVINLMGMRLDALDTMIDVLISSNDEMLPDSEIITDPRHDEWVEKLTSFYNKKTWSDAWVKKAVGYKITKDDYKKVTGRDFV